MPEWDVGDVSISGISLGSESWRVFSLEREVGVPRDEHSRVLARSVSGDHLVPTVSEELYEKGFRVEWPRGRRFAVCLTHDVDLAHPPSGRVKKALEAARSRHDLGAALLWMLGSASKWRLYNPYSLRQVAKVEAEYSATLPSESDT